MSTPALLHEYERFRALGCDPAEVQESFTHSGGAGGQNVNKVATCVQLNYPRGKASVKMQVHRTQASNRIAAWRLLVKTLVENRERQAEQAKAAREKHRRQTAPKPGWLKRRMREGKRHQAQRRSARAVGPVGDD
jgi:protein subunit release factor B